MHVLSTKHSKCVIQSGTNVRSLVACSMKCLSVKSQKEQISRDRVMDSAKDLCRIINQSIDSNEISGWVFDQN